VPHDPSSQELKAYASGGFFLVKREKLQGGLEDPEARLPDPFFSASDLCEFLPGAWAYSWIRTEPKERVLKAREFGIREEQIAQIVKWVTAKQLNHELGLISVFSSGELARQFLRVFDIPRDDLVLFGIGLHPKHLKAFEEDARPAPGYGDYGIHEMVTEETPLPTGGTICGFEPLEYELGSFHSWLCCYAHKEASKKYSIRPNQFGFISDFDDACRISEALTNGILPAEPGTYFPWIIAVYPL